jgi:putative flippase GtrA
MLGLPVIIATPIGSEIGLLATFVFHQRWTYSHVDHSHRSLSTKFVHFHMSSWSGVVLITVLESIGVKVFKMDYMVSLVITAGIAMFWNFFWTKYYIFRGHTPKPLLQPENIAREG